MTSLLPALLLAACVNPGQAPEPGLLNFPSALALSTEGSPAAFLFVANSNFNVRFNAGTLQAYDLAALDAALARAAAEGTCEASGECPVEDLEPLIVSEVALGSQATSMAIGPTGDRLYLPMRSDADLTFVDWTGSALACDAVAEAQEAIPVCAEVPFRTSQPLEGRDLALEGDPADVVVGTLGDLGGGEGSFVLMLLDGLTSARVALYIDRPRPEGQVQGPLLVDVLDGFDEEPVTLARVPGEPFAWATSALGNTLQPVGIVLDPADPDRAFLYAGDRLPINGVDDARNVQQVVFDPRPDSSLVYVLGRRPEGVIVLDRDLAASADGRLRVVDVMEVGVGPSRMRAATVGGRPYLFVTTFERQQIFVLDLELRALAAVVSGFDGPFDLIVDAPRDRLYVTDFATSVIRIVDIAPLAEGRPPTVVGRLGAIRSFQTLTGT
jgi:hypothetical protein